MIAADFVTGAGALIVWIALAIMGVFAFFMPLMVFAIYRIMVRIEKLVRSMEHYASWQCSQERMRQERAANIPQAY